MSALGTKLAKGTIFSGELNLDDFELAAVQSLCPTTTGFIRWADGYLLLPIYLKFFRRKAFIGA